MSGLWTRSRKSSSLSWADRHGWSSLATDLSSRWNSANPECTSATRFSGRSISTAHPSTHAQVNRRRPLASVDLLLPLVPAGRHPASPQRIRRHHRSPGSARPGRSGTDRSQGRTRRRPDPVHLRPGLLASHLPRPRPAPATAPSPRCSGTSTCAPVRSWPSATTAAMRSATAARTRQTTSGCRSAPQSA
jgi:hypothetical protein